MQAWTGLFDGLRQLGNLYYASKGAPAQQYSNPYQGINQVYQQQKQVADDLDNYRRQYAQRIYDISRQAEQDQIQREAHKASLEYKKAQEKSVEEKARREEEKNKAMIRRYDALERKDFYAAEYNRAKAEGYSDEAAARMAKYYADAELARARAEAGGFAPPHGTVKTSTHTDEYGNQTTTTTETTPTGQKKGEKTNKSGFFGKGK